MQCKEIQRKTCRHPASNYVKVIITYAQFCTEESSPHMACVWRHSTKSIVLHICQLFRAIKHFCPSTYFTVRKSGVHDWQNLHVRILAIVEEYRWERLGTIRAARKWPVWQLLRISSFSWTRDMFAGAESLYCTQRFKSRRGTNYIVHIGCHGISYFILLCPNL